MTIVLEPLGAGAATSGADVIRIEANTVEVATETRIEPSEVV